MGTIRLVLYLFLAIALSAPLSGQAVQLPTDIGTSARMIGIGNIEGFDPSAAGVFENPAGHMGRSGFSVSGFATRIMDEVNYANIAFKLVSPIGVVGFGMADTSTGGLPATFRNTSSEIESRGDFGFRTILSKLTYQVPIWERLVAGVGLNYFYSESLNIYARGWNADFGMALDLNAFQISSVVKNPLTLQKIRYSNGGSATFPFQWTVAGKYSTGVFETYGQFKWLRLSENPLLAAGLKVYPVFPNKIFSFSAGIRELTAGDRKIMVAPLGLGLELGQLDFHFAYSRNDYVGDPNNYYVSLTSNF